MRVIFTDGREYKKVKEVAVDPALKGNGTFNLLLIFHPGEEREVLSIPGNNWPVDIKEDKKE